MHHFNWAITNMLVNVMGPKQSESGFTFDFTTSEDIIPVEMQRFQEVKNWLDFVKHNQLPPNLCVGKEEEIFTTEDFFMRNGPCHENGAIKKLGKKISFFKRIMLFNFHF